MRILGWGILCFALAGCDAIYTSPSVKKTDAAEAAVGQINIIELDAAAVSRANSSPYTPRKLPRAYSTISGPFGSDASATALPEAVHLAETRPGPVITRLPPATPIRPYKIGVADVLLLSTPGSTAALAALPGLLAAQDSRQGYTVQDDGAIAIPDVGRVPVAGLTLEETEAEIFKALVSRQIDPTFSLEISEFNSQRAVIGGAVKAPALVPVTLKPLFLEEALTSVGGPTGDPDFITIRIYRGGQLYQIPLGDVNAGELLKKVQIENGDMIYFDTEYDLDKAQAYFTEQIKLLTLRRDEQDRALTRMKKEMDIRQMQLNETRSNFAARLEFGAVERDYVFLAGELTQSRVALPFEVRTTLADVIYDKGGVTKIVGDMAEIFVIRSAGKAPGQGVTAYHLNAKNAVNLVLATQMEVRPNDIIFVSEQPVTKWNRSIDQLLPTLFNLTAAAN